MAKRFPILLCSFLLVHAPILPATIIQIPSDYPTIQAGINAAEDGDTVLVADGIYRGYGNQNISFMGKAIVVKSENGPETCIIDCEMQVCHGFYFGNGEDYNSVLQGFTIAYA